MSWVPSSLTKTPEKGMRLRSSCHAWQSRKPSLLKMPAKLCALFISTVQTAGHWRRMLWQPIFRQLRRRTITGVIEPATFLQRNTLSHKKGPEINRGLLSFITILIYLGISAAMPST